MEVSYEAEINAAPMTLQNGWIAISKGKKKFYRPITL